MARARPFDPRQQLPGIDAERRGELDERVCAGQPPPALHEADLGAVQTGERAEFFLREPSAAASREHVLAKTLGGVLVSDPAVHHASSS